MKKSDLQYIISEVISLNSSFTTLSNKLNAPPPPAPSPSIDFKRIHICWCLGSFDIRKPRIEYCPLYLPEIHVTKASVVILLWKRIQKPQTFWPPNFAGKSKCSNRMTFIENVQLNNHDCSLGFSYYFFLMTYIWAKIDIKLEETRKNMIFFFFFFIFDNFQQLASVEHSWIPKWYDIQVE